MGTRHTRVPMAVIYVLKSGYDGERWIAQWNGLAQWSERDTGKERGRERKSRREMNVFANKKKGEER